MNRFNRSIVDHPWLTIALFVLVTAILAFRVPELYIETDVRAMLPKGNPEVAYNDWVEDYFGITDPAVVMIVNEDPDGIFTPATLALVMEISEGMAALDSIDGEDLVSLSAIDNITGDDDLLIVEPFYEKPPATREEALAIRDAVFDNSMMVGSLVSKDGHATMIAGERYDGFDKVQLHLDLKEIVAASSVTDERIIIVGRPVVEGELGKQAQGDLRFMFPLVVLAAAALLLLSLRSVRGVLLPLLVVITSVVWTLGFMAWTNATFFPLSTMMPTLLVAIGVAAGIHILHHFMLGVAEQPERPAADTVFATMQQMTPPVVMTSLTTAAGLGSLAVSAMRPIQQFGIFTAFGVLAGMVFSLTLLPAVLCLLPLPRRAAERTARAQSEKGGVVNVLLETLTTVVIRRPLLAMSGTMVLLVIGLAGIPRIVVENSMLENFSPDNPVKLADAEFRARFHGSHPMEIILDGGETDAWKQPEFLRAVEGLQKHIEASGYTGKTRSIVDYVKRMNAVMNPDDAAAERVPDSRELVAQYLLIYSMSGDPDDFEDVIDYDYRMANVRAQTNSDSSIVIERAMNSIDGYAAEHLAPLGIETHVSGISRTSHAFIALIIAGQIRSLALALVMVVLLSAILCRSLVAGFFTVIPVAVATILNFGLMAWVGVNLSVATALVSSMGIGVGVDYAIHFVFRYRQDRRAAMSREAAMRETMSTSGVAIFYNALVVLAGFLVLAASEFPPNHGLGVLVSLNMAVCFIGTVTLLAAALHVIQPAFVRPPEERVRAPEPMQIDEDPPESKAA